MLTPHACSRPWFGMLFFLLGVSGAGSRPTDCGPKPGFWRFKLSQLEPGVLYRAEYQNQRSRNVRICPCTCWCIMLSLLLPSLPCRIFRSQYFRVGLLGYLHHESWHQLTPTNMEMGMASGVPLKAMTPNPPFMHAPEVCEIALLVILPCQEIYKLVLLHSAPEGLIRDNRLISHPSCKDLCKYWSPTYRV